MEGGKEWEGSRRGGGTLRNGIEILFVVFRFLVSIHFLSSLIAAVELPSTISITHFVFLHQ